MFLKMQHSPQAQRPLAASKTESCLRSKLDCAANQVTRTPRAARLQRREHVARATPAFGANVTSGFETRTWRKGNHYDGRKSIRILLVPVMWMGKKEVDRCRVVAGITPKHLLSSPGSGDIILDPFIVVQYLGE
jgi:hypothetical protein